VRRAIQQIHRPDCRRNPEALTIPTVLVGFLTCVRRSLHLKCDTCRKRRTVAFCLGKKPAAISAVAVAQTKGGDCFANQSANFNPRKRRRAKTHGFVFRAEDGRAGAKFGGREAHEGPAIASPCSSPALMSSARGAGWCGAVSSCVYAPGRTARSRLKLRCGRLLP